MTTSTPVTATWQRAQVQSPHLDRPVDVVTAKNVPYLPNANRLQNLNIYLALTPETAGLVNQPVTKLPRSDLRGKSVPQWYVHVHGGAWRAPALLADSIEAMVAHAFTDTSPNGPQLTGVVSINYTLSPFPTHPTDPYDANENGHSDPAREAVHPAHVRDVLTAFALLRKLGLTEDDSYVLSGHSCGACLAFQSVLMSPEYWGLADLEGPPRPAALFGTNGLYDLPGLVHNLGLSHARLENEYRSLIREAFGSDENQWARSSPGLVDIEMIAERIQQGKSPRLILLDQSTTDELVPVSQTDNLELRLRTVPGLKVTRSHRCTGSHAAPWEQGYMISQILQDAQAQLR